MEIYEFTIKLIFDDRNYNDFIGPLCNLAKEHYWSVISEVSMEYNYITISGQRGFDELSILLNKKPIAFRA